MNTTTSICSTCYREISALIEERSDGVWLEKMCPEHGPQRGLVEPDLEFYRTFGFGRDCPLEHDLLGIPITNVCNTRCRLCYYALGREHRTVTWCVNKALEYERYHIVLTGGEPTCHPELFKIIRRIPNFHAIFTNGLAFRDPDYVRQFMNATRLAETRRAGFLPVEISIHTNGNQERLEALAVLRKLGQRVLYGMFSITNSSEVEEVARIWEEWDDVVTNIRIRTPFNSWRQAAPKTLFLSQVYAAVRKALPGFVPTLKLGGNSIYNVNLEHGGRYLGLCCAPSKDAFDMQHIGCAPKMLAEDGNVYPGPLAFMVNEGLEKGFKPLTVTPNKG